MDERQTFWEGVNKLGDAGRGSLTCAHKDLCDAVGQTGGEKGPKGIGSGSLLPSCFSLFCRVKVQNLKEYKISEFEAGLPSLIESQNIIMKSFVGSVDLFDLLLQALKM